MLPQDQQGNTSTTHCLPVSRAPTSLCWCLIPCGSHYPHRGPACSLCWRLTQSCTASRWEGHCTEKRLFVAKSLLKSLYSSPKVYRSWSKPGSLALDCGSCCSLHGRKRPLYRKVPGYSGLDGSDTLSSAYQPTNRIYIPYQWECVYFCTPPWALETSLWFPLQFCGGLISAGCQAFTQPLSLPLLNRTGGENEMRKLMGQDKEIVNYPLPSQAKQTWGKLI